MPQIPRTAVQLAVTPHYTDPLKMSYQVLARRWRPQRFDEIVGQPAVTRTLKNAIGSRRLAHAFVFAGPRGVGKTTTARILARALNCAKGPTADPCGQCEACVEIANGRDLDVLEIDAATHTQVDNVREVIIAGLAIAPARDRYKIFIIDEVHQLSSASFNALLKSIEEPPSHVVFMMATTELEKIPETVLSRSQVYELRSIGVSAIATQLRRIVDAEGITVSDAALQLIARDADGSLRDAESKLDQVIAFTGQSATDEEVSTVLGLVGRDLVLDIMEAVAGEDLRAGFELAGRAVDLGSDLRLVCRELARAARDLLVLNVDPDRLSDADIASEGERTRLKALANRFSREDLLRGFDLWTRAEHEIRSAAQPRYHFEMALLRWMYLRKLVSIEQLIQSAEGAAPAKSVSGSVGGLPRPSIASVARPSSVSDSSSRTSPSATSSARPSVAPSSSSTPAQARSAQDDPGGFKERLLAEIRKKKAVFYNTVVAQAQRIEVAADRIVFTFSSTQRALRDHLEQHCSWLEATVEEVGGQKRSVVAVLAESEGPTSSGRTPGEGSEEAAKKSALKAKALADTGVQAMLDVFPAEIRDVEEM